MPVKELSKEDHTKIKLSDLQSNVLINSTTIEKKQIKSQIQVSEETNEIQKKMQILSTFMIDIVNQISSFEIEKVKNHQDLLNQTLINEQGKFEEKYKELIAKNSEIKEKIINAEKEIEIKIKNSDKLKLDFSGLKDSFAKLIKNPEGEKSTKAKDINSNIQNLIEKNLKFENELNDLNNQCEALILELINTNNELAESINNFQKLEIQFANDSKINIIEEKNKLLNEIQNTLNNSLMEYHRNARLIKKAQKENMHLLEELEDVKKEYSSYREEICKYKERIKQGNLNFEKTRSQLQNELDSYQFKLNELANENEKMHNICESNPSNKLIKPASSSNLGEKINEIFDKLIKRESLIAQQPNSLEFKESDDELNTLDSNLIEENNLISTLEKEINISQVQYEAIQNKKQMMKELENEILNYEEIYSNYQNTNFINDLEELMNKRILLEEQLSKKKEMLNLVEGNIEEMNKNLNIISSVIENKENELKSKEIENEKLKEENLNKIQELDKYINDIKVTKQEIEEIEAKTKEKTNYLKIAKASLKEKRAKDNLLKNPKEGDFKGKFSSKEGFSNVERNDQDAKLETNSLDQLFSKSSSSQGEPAQNINYTDKNEEDKAGMDEKNIQSKAYEYNPQSRDYDHEGKFVNPNLDDRVDRMFADYMEKLNVPVNLKKIHGGQYIFGTKKIMAKIQNDKLIIRIGGGYMMIDEFLSAYTAQELAKAQLDQKIEASRIKQIKE